MQTPFQSAADALFERCESLHSLLAILTVAESGEAEVAFASRTEADTWGTDDVWTVEQVVEELPRGHTLRTTKPDVRCIDATIDLIAELGERLAHDLGVVHIVVDGRLDLLLAFWGIDGLCGAMLNVAGAIELGALTTIPERIESDALAILSDGCDLLRDDGIAAADAGEASGLRVAVELDSALLSTFDLVDRMRDVLLLNVSLVGGIVHDQ